MSGTQARNNSRSKTLTRAGLSAVAASFVLVVAQVILFSGAALANEQTNWTGNGSNNLPCEGGTTLWILTGFGNDAGDVSNVVLYVNGNAYPMSVQGNGFRADVPGPGTDTNNTTAYATWSWDGDGDAPTPTLTISHCTPGTTTTTTTTTPPETTTTTTPPETTTTTTPPETTTTTTSPPQTTTTTTTTPPETTTTTTSPPQTTTTTTEPPTVEPTTVEPTTDEPTVEPTTVEPDEPKGLAFTGPESAVPLGALALMLLTGGTGLMWAGSRRRKDEDA